MVESGFFSNMCCLYSINIHCSKNTIDLVCSSLKFASCDARNPKFGRSDLENDLLTSTTSERAQWFFFKNYIFLKFELLLGDLEDPELKTGICKFLTRKPSYSSFFSTWCTDFKNVIFEKNHWALSEVVETIGQSEAEIYRCWNLLILGARFFKRGRSTCYFFLPWAFQYSYLTQNINGCPFYVG